MKRIFDFLLLNVAFVAAVMLFNAIPGFYLAEPLNLRALFICWNVAALIMLAAFPKMSMRSVLFLLVFMACVALGKFPMPGRRRLVTFAVFTPFALLVAKRLARHVAHLAARFGNKGHKVALIGETKAFEAFAKSFWTLHWKDYDGVEIFDSVAKGRDWVKANHCDEIYCSLAQETLGAAQQIFDYAENHLVRFYGVPEKSEYFERNMVATTICDTTVLMPRSEPLRKLSNRVLKRSLDIAISATFLATAFVPILILVAFKIKKESPGPIFFRQRRHGLNGQEFLCWKFRSMHVNDQSDTAQTAKDDPRKFPFGDFMRRTNIDELPQFINVLTGDMSVVGPRPHPCKMTDDFGEVVNRYRVRLYAKPGVTGWAQVNGARGAALELGDMVKRVRLDIWYLEHWTFLLDLRIIAETFWQTIRAKNKNAF